MTFGLFIFPEIPILRIIGRLSFPLFAWLIANGAVHSKNEYKYLIRLFLIGVISQIPYIILYKYFIPTYWGLNIFFTLSLGLLGIIIYKKAPNKILGISLVGLTAFVASLLQSSYGAAGVLSIFLYFVFYKDIKKMIFSQLSVFLIFYTLPIIFSFISGSLKYIDFVKLYQPVGIASIVFIILYSGIEGKKLKGLIYLFYPIHLFLIYLFILLN